MVKTTEDGYYIIIKVSIQEKYRTTVNIYAPNIGAPKYIKQILTGINGEIDSHTIIIGDSNTSLLSMYRSSRKKINKETLGLNEILEQKNLSGIRKAFYLKTAEYMFFTSAHRTFSKIDYI